MTKTWTTEELRELTNLFHLAKEGMRSPRRSRTKYYRQVWAANEYHREYPETSVTAAYKELERQENKVRYRRAYD